MMKNDRLPRIDNLRADFAPHREWPVRKWYFANPIWFYHKPCDCDDMIASQAFYKLVDPELCDICKGLHDAGLHTTPSCEGHFYARDRFEKVWAELKREEPKIRDGGLVVKDSETDQELLFHEPSYQLPWPSFDDFYAAADAQQGVGCLGIIIPKDRGDLVERLRKIERNEELVKASFDDEIGRRLNANLFAIETHPRTAQQVHEIWRRLTHEVLALIRPNTQVFAA